MFCRLVKRFAEKESVTEELKAESQMLWIKKMCNIQASAREIVNQEIVFI